MNNREVKGVSTEVGTSWEKVVVCILDNGMAVVYGYSIKEASRRYSNTYQIGEIGLEGKGCDLA